MKITKLTYPPERLAALPPAQLSALLLLGHFLTEANWLQKLLWLGTQDSTGHKAEQDARLAFNLMVTNLFAAKIHEGWNRLRTGPLSKTIDDLPLSEGTRLNREQLASRLDADSILHKIRVAHASHYPPVLSLDGLPNIDQSDLALYLTPHSGDTLSVMSTLSAAAAMNEIGGDPVLEVSLGRILDEVLSVARIYSDYLQGALIALMDAAGLDDPKEETFDDPAAPKFEDLRLRYFSVVPDTPPEIQ